MVAAAIRGNRAGVPARGELDRVIGILTGRLVDTHGHSDPGCGCRTADANARQPPIFTGHGFQWAMLLGATAWVVGATFLRWPAPLYAQFGSNSTIDSAFFALAGRVVRNGQVPYVAFWDHKPPLIYLIDALALTVSGGAVWGIWLVAVAALVATLGLAWLAWRPVVGPTAAVIGITWVAFSIGIVAPFNLTEGFVLPVQAATMLILARWSPPGAARSRPRSAVGALAGLAFMLRPNLIGTPAAVAGNHGGRAALTRRARELPALVGGSLVGAALVIAPILIWLGIDGAFGRSGTRSSITTPCTPRRRGCPASGRRSKASRTRPFTERCCCRWLAGSSLRIASSSDRRRRYAPPVLSSRCSGRPSKSRSRPSPAGRTCTISRCCCCRLPSHGLVACEVFALVARAGAPTVTERWRRTRPRSSVPPSRSSRLAGRDSASATTGSDASARQVDATAQYVRDHSPANSRLLVWGHASDVYVFSDRAPASRFVYPLALLTPRYANDALVAGFVEELRASAPPLIVDATPGAARSEALVPPLAGWNPTWQYPESGVAWWTMTPALRAFYDYVATNFTIIDSVGPRHWVIYARRSDLDQR